MITFLQPLVAIPFAILPFRFFFHFKILSDQTETVAKRSRNGREVLQVNAALN